MDYSIRALHISTGFLEIACQFNISEAGTHQFQLPAWRPGRYFLQNFAKNIRNLRVSFNEQPISFIKTTKDCWEVTTLSEGTLKFVYEYYARQYDAGGSVVDDEQMYINPITCLLYKSGLEHTQECSLSIDVPKNFSIASGLPFEGNVLKTKSFAELVDTPFIASENLQKVSYKVPNSDCEYFVWFQGLKNPLEVGKIIENFQAFTKAQIDIFGSIEYPEYHFLVQILAHPYYHGVEHARSTVIVLGPETDFYSKSFYDNLLGVSSHELFHSWNICRIRPIEMSPYDYSKENYFRTGYVAEGITTYYGDMLLKRSGVWSESMYISELNVLLKRQFSSTSEKTLSVADSSFELWLDGYEPGVQFRKSSIYVKGAWAAIILDLMIRDKFQHQKSMDDILRILWERHGKTGLGYSENDYQSICEEVFEGTLKTYFDELINGNFPLEPHLNAALGTIGLTLKIQASANEEEALLGIKVDPQSKITEILDEGEGSKYFMPNDQFVAINNEKFSINTWRSLLKNKKKHSLQFFRKNTLFSVEIYLESLDCKGYTTYTIEYLADENGKFQELRKLFWGPSQTF